MDDRLFPVATVAPHPAKFTPKILDAISTEVRWDASTRSGPYVVLDPFAGVGGIHAIAMAGIHTVGVELEPEWARAHPRNVIGDATRLPFADATFACVATSPAYASRMADSYDGRDGSTRHTYRLSLGRPLSPNSGAALQWGNDYKILHHLAWDEAVRVLRPGGMFVLNISNHIRAGAERNVSGFHVDALVAAGMGYSSTRTVKTPRLRHGANAEARPDVEYVHVLYKRRRPR